MGLSTSKTTNKPIYNQRVEGAADSVTSAYNAAQPGLQEGADQFRGLLSSAIERYNAGDPNITAARNYDADVLSGRYLDQSNPHLQAMIDRTNNTVKNQTQAAYGSRGLTNGSDYALAIADRLAANETNLRYQDYGAERGRMDAASGRVPGLIAAENGLLDPAFQAYDAMQDPLRAAIGYGGSIGGLLGQYQTVKQKTPIGQALLQAASNAAAAYAGGG